LVSLLREDLLLCSSYLPLGVPNELYLQAINEFSSAIAEEKKDFCKGSVARTIFTLFLFCFILFLLASFYQKKSFLYSCFYLLAFSFARMGTLENTKLCDFTSTKNNDFICTPIMPPAPEAIFYEIKPAFFKSCYERAIFRCQF
jgi:hypothetical protein